jgi:rhamnulokinase
MTRSPVMAAVDLGASSGRVLVGRLEGGRLLTEEAGRFANTPVRSWADGRDGRDGRDGSPGGREELRWDVLALWHGVQEGLRVAAAQHGPLDSIGIDTWAVDHGLLDADGRLLGNPWHYRDARTADAPARFAEHLTPDEHYRHTGTQVQAFNTVYQLAASAADAQLRSARDLLLMPDLLGYWLTGTRVAELTNASTTGMLDAATRGWSGPVLDALERMTGQDLARLLPPLIDPGTVVAPVLTPVVDRLGLGGARLVSVGSHDTASAVAAVPMDPRRAAYISSGTWSLVGVELAAPVLTEESRRANFTNELGVDGTVRYLRNVSGLWLLQESMRTWRDQGDEQHLPTLLAAAAEVPSLRTVIDVDHPDFTPPGGMPARIARAALASGQPMPSGPAETTRCILDSLALGYRRAVRDAARLSGVDVEVVHLVGGGTRNELLCRLTADATGRPVVAGPTEGTAVGNLLVQALAIGALDGGLPAVREVVAASTPVRRWEPTGTDLAWQRAADRLGV